MTLKELGIEPGATRLVLEIGNCRGDLNWAAKAVDTAAQSGTVWGIKGQFYDRTKLVTRTAPTYGHDTVAEPETQWENFADQLSPEQWLAVHHHTSNLNMVFFASVFDTDTIQHHNIDMPLYKIASADITNQPLIETVAATGKPIVLSTGGATLGEIQRAYKWIAAINADTEVLPLICTLSYPTLLKDANLARITWWQDNVGPMVGYSDHTIGIAAMIAARNLGAVMIEKHYTVTPGAGADHDFALTPEWLDGYATGTTPRNMDLLLGDAELGPRECEVPAVQQARRSLAAKTDIPAGHTITAADLIALRPGTGAYKPYDMNRLVGRIAPTDIPAGELIPLIPELPGSAARASVSASLTVE